MVHHDELLSLFIWQAMIPRCARLCLSSSKMDILVFFNDNDAGGITRLSTHPASQPSLVRGKKKKKKKGKAHFQW